MHVVSGLILRGVSEYAANKRDGGVKYDKQEGVPSAGGSGPSSEILVGILNLQQLGVRPVVGSPKLKFLVFKLKAI